MNYGPLGKWRKATGGLVVTRKMAESHKWPRATWGKWRKATSKLQATWKIAEGYK